MLGPDWKEGHSMLGREGPVELALPEDSAFALKLICAVIHHRNNNAPQTLPAGSVLEVAITADKYDCVDALKFASGNWLRPGKNEAGDLMLLTAAAYLFKNVQAFKEVTRALILNHDGPYLALLCEKVISAMPWRAFCLLEGQRSSARLELADILIEGIDDGTGMCVHRCGWTSKYAYAYLKLLQRKNLWPARLLDISISEAIELAEKMPDPTPEESSISCRYERNHAAPEYRESRCKSLEIMHNRIGLCLHCVRSDSMNSYCNHGSHSA